MKISQAYCGISAATAAIFFFCRGLFCPERGEMDRDLFFTQYAFCSEAF
jgi:hypothetical protein